ncbi:MAG: DegT/DnrJ/EryC1/StrS family aminotransferase [Fidelibacterota bacterium]
MSKLALFGGNPIRTEPFPSWPRPSSSLGESVLKTLENENWGVGSKAITRFEESFAAFQDAKYCISTNSGTAALWVALKAGGVKAGDEVIIPAYTFIATASAVLTANAVPVFVDIDENTLNIDPKLIEKAITEKTKAIMPVHIGGNPADMDSIIKIGKQYNIPIIEDAAQAHGAEWNGKKVGAIGLGGIFSFQTSKNMTAGEGGAIVTNNDPFKEACFSYHNCGRVRDGKWYEHQHLGGNFRLNALAASLLSPQLKTIGNDMNIRDKNKEKLDNALKQIDGLELTESYPRTTRSSHHLYILKYKKEKLNEIHRDIFFKAMQAEGVYTYAGYKPLYRENLFITDPKEYPWLKDHDYAAMSLPVTEKICDEESVWLKQNHLLGNNEDIQDIIDAFEKVTNVIKHNPEKLKGH